MKIHHKVLKIAHLNISKHCLTVINTVFLICRASTVPYIVNQDFKAHLCYQIQQSLFIFYYTYFIQMNVFN